ncbi:MAG: CHY zinc finger protein [Mycobacteriaceae bacterium]|uniref:CHY zinc finger protein n=1 Tax=Corynebacterium sp. TaxID=1720 RepID=UPI003F9D4233
MTWSPDDGRELLGGVGCAHWHSPLDVAAIRFHCCGHVYPCLHCHSENEDHAVEPWPAGAGTSGESSGEPAVLCRTCGHWMTVGEYLSLYGEDDGDGEQREPSCPSCAAPFNPGCALHSGIYFGGGPGNR